MTSIPVSQKKRGRPKTGETPRVGVRMDQELVEAIEAVQRDRNYVPSLSGTIRSILREWLRQHGYLDPRDHERIRPEDLNASNDD